MAGRTPKPRSPKVPEIRTGDTVVVLAGKDAGKRGTVERVIRRQPSPSSARSVFRRGSAAGGVSVVVEGLNIAKRHTKPRQSAGTNDRVPRSSRAGSSTCAAAPGQPGDLYVCASCGKPTRVAHATLDTGRRVRVCRHCGEQMEGKA